MSRITVAVWILLCLCLASAYVHAFEVGRAQIEVEPYVKGGFIAWDQLSGIGGHKSSVGLGLNGVAAFGRGIIPWELIHLDQNTIDGAAEAASGDIDDDGDVDADDLTAFTAVLVGEPVEDSHPARCDINGDGKVDGRDIAPFIELLLDGGTAPLLGDVDGDGDVDLQDAKALAAVLVGDPSKPGPYVIRGKFAPGVINPPHTHDKDRAIVVISGTWHTGIGDTIETDTMQPLPAGTLMVHPAGGAHYDGSKEGEVIVQIAGVGPVSTDYLK